MATSETIDSFLLVNAEKPMVQRTLLTRLTWSALPCLPVFLWVFLSLLLSLFLLGWPLAAQADVSELGNEDLEKLRAAGVAIIDVRRADEWQQTGMIEGSHGITFFDEKGNYDVEKWLEQIGAIVRPDQPVVLICASGVRSSKIAWLLDSRLGFKDVSNVTRGIYDWLAAKRPVVEWTP